MNILVEELPEAIEIDGREYEINSDFRSCLRIILAFEDPELAGTEKQAVMINNLYKEHPENITAAIEKGVRFLNGGENSKTESDLRLYSFEKDAPYIFAAFKQTHSIDLDTVDMHWWKFMSLFMDLGSETTFSGMVGLRKRVLTGKATKEERKAYSEMRDIMELPAIDNRTLEEREAEEEFMRKYRQGRQKCNTTAR